MRKTASQLVGLAFAQRRLLAVAAVLVVLAPGSARAADVVYPNDGSTVGAHPTFDFDYNYGDAEVEFSARPDIQTSGPDQGEFVDRAYWNEWGLHGASTGYSFSSTLDAGRYYWHAHLRADPGPYDYGPDLGWGPIRTLTVSDEAPVINGYTLVARRVKPTIDCARVEFSGKIAWTDNDDKPESTFSLVVEEVGGDRLETKDVVLDYDDRYTVSVCTRHTQLTVTPQISDRSGQFTQGESRTITVDPPIIEPIPMLTAATTKRYLGIALARRFGDSYRYGFGKQISCARRSRTRMRCRVVWAIGDASYYGSASIWLGRGASGVVAWNYGWTIRRLDEYCAEVTHGKHCVKTYRVT